MSNWVIRRVSDGLFWASGARWVPLDGAAVYGQTEHDFNLVVKKGCLVEPGEEWVELDDAGQPVEAAKVEGPVRRFAMRSPSGLYHMGCGDWTEHLGRAMTYTKAWTPSGEADVMVPVLVHADGTVTLDEPAPAIAQPSPYSESADAPIALVPIDDVQLVAQTSEALGVLYHELARMTEEAAQLERQRDEAATRLRGGL